MDLLIQETKNTPQIFFRPSLNECVISGRSYPYEALPFYEPVLKWISLFETEEMSNCNFHFKLEFFNTCSSRVLLDILIRLRRIMEKGEIKLSIKWYYEEDDEDMKESGEFFMEMAKIPVEFVSY